MLQKFPSTRIKTNDDSLILPKTNTVMIQKPDIQILEKLKKQTFLCPVFELRKCPIFECHSKSQPFDDRTDFDQSGIQIPTV